MGDTVVTRLDAAPCELGEGPHYDPARDTAWWFDILGMRLLEHRFAQGTTVAHPLPRMGSVIAGIDEGRQLVVLDDGLHVRSRTDGSLSLLTPLEADLPQNRSNDGRVHPSGRLWVGTMGRRAEKGAGTIYWCDGQAVVPLWRGVTIPNSICFSPDGGTGYFADTVAATVWRVALDPADGRPRGEPEPFLTARNLPRGGHFDGSVMDADGVLWNAAWGSGSVTGFRPDGSVVRTFGLPAAQTSCPCFAGPALDRLLVTSAWQGYGERERASDPEAGRTFVIHGAFRGVADSAFIPATID